MVKYTFEAIGTHWEIDINDEISKSLEISLYKKIQNRIEIFDKNYSRFRHDSLITKIAKESGRYRMPDDFEKMISMYKKAYVLTNGIVTPLIGDVLVSLGYDENYSLVKKESRKAYNWDEVLRWNQPDLIVNTPTVLDFGACGKGYLVDIISEIIESEGIKQYVVDGSGDMRVRGGKIKVGLEHPNDKESVIGTIVLKDQSLCGSSGNRRKWADVNHIVNPRTGVSPQEILSVWVVAKDTITADVLTTCLFFVQPDLLMNEFDFEYIILGKDLSVQSSNGINAEIFNE